MKKLNYYNLGSRYSTPYIGIIVNNEDYQLSFIVLNHHWWITIKRKKK